MYHSGSVIRSLSAHSQKRSREQSDGTPVQAYSSLIGNCLIAVPCYSPCSVSFGLLRCYVVPNNSTLCRRSRIAWVNRNLCLLIGLVATIVHQTRNTFSSKDTGCGVIGLLFSAQSRCCRALRLSQLRCKRPTGSRHYPHLLGMICYSIFSKVWLLALVWSVPVR